ncbi:MAG: HTH-type transcriptional repressor NanR [Desulfovibrio sp.]
MAPLQEIKKIIVHDAIIESVTDYVKASGLAIGDRIPSERALAERLKVSRPSVRGALKALESEGVLEIRHGGGTYLKSLSSPVYYQYTSDHRENLSLLKNLVQARQAVEEWAVVEAAARITSQQAKDMLAEEKRQLRAVEDPSCGETVSLPNMDLEVAITRIVGNMVLLDMHEKLEKMWKQAYKNLQMTAFPAKTRYEHHKTIIKALAAHDASAALNAIRFHNRSLEKHIVAAIEKLDKHQQPEER